MIYTEAATFSEGDLTSRRRIRSHNALSFSLLVVIVYTSLVKEFSMADPTPQKQFPVCPNCGSGKVVRSLRRDAQELVLRSMLFQVPYRCKPCNHRFFGMRREAARQVRSPALRLSRGRMPLHHAFPCSKCE